jgi:hypothetical protein
MTRLNTAAQNALREAGITQAAWVRNWTAGRWHGDACGCPDDRCTGSRHDANEECHCLPALIGSVLHATAIRQGELPEREAEP